MSVKGSIERMKDRRERDLKDKEIEQKERERKSGFITGVLGSVSSMLPKGKYTIGNGPEWYKKFVKPIEAVVNIPTWLKVSVPQTLTSAGEFKVSDAIQVLDVTSQALRTIGVAPMNAKPTRDDSTRSIARVVCHEFMPHVGVSGNFDLTGNTVAGDTSSDYSINRATLMTITELGKINSRAIEPDPSIPGMYFLSGVEVYAALAELKWVIDTAVHYQDNDYTIPKYLIEAKGYSYDDVTSNLPEYRKQYMMLREFALSAIPLPDTLTILARRIWLNTVIIRDTANSKGCSMLFKQRAFGQLSSDGTSIEFNNFTDSTKSSIATLSRYINICISRIATDEEFTTFISNMRAASMKFAPIPELNAEIGYTIEANDEVKLQLMNIVTLPAYYTFVPSHWNIKHDSDGLIYGPRSLLVRSETANPLAAVAMGRLLRAYVDVRTLSSKSELLNSFIGWDADKMLVATRLHPIFNSHWAYDGDSHTLSVILDIASCGTEIVLRSAVMYELYDSTEGSSDASASYFYTANSGTFSVTLANNIYTVSGMANDSYSSSELALLHEIDGFYPVYQITKGALSGLKLNLSNGSLDADATFEVTPYVQFDDFISIGRVDLARIHDACVLSEFYLDSSAFGKFSR